MRRHFVFVVAGALTLSVVGCRHLPEDSARRGAAIGGAAGAVTGAIIADNTLVGAVLGGLLGAGGGYVIGAEMDRVEDGDRAGAEEAARRAERRPVTAAQARQADTADINNDGFVTLDEVVAMNEAGFTDQEMIRRLEATDQVFELTAEQERHLVAQGVSPVVVDEMTDMNRHLLDDSPPDDVIGRRAPA